jgi:putative nucleotidyltransferase with HDIG domain
MTTWNELSQVSIDDVVAWAAGKPWCCAMANCQQDAEWHAEGDVWTHTKLVLAQLPKLEEWPRLTSVQQRVLIFAALFHDAGKPETSEVDPATGRIHSPKHALRGEHLARQVLREIECGVELREEIARLVRFHGRPAFLLEKADPQHELISLSWLLNHKLLYLLALADTRGRATEATSRPEENLHLWKMIAEENNCFDRPYAFANDHARFLFYRQALSDLLYVPHEEYRCTVTVMSGLPGSGKDTWLKLNAADLPVVSLDDFREQLGVEPTENQGVVIQAGKERCRELLRAKTSFAFCATNLLRQTRARWIDLFAQYNARVRIAYVEPPFSTLLSRNKQRTRIVPEEVIRDLAAKVEPPTWTEAHELVLAE